MQLEHLIYFYWIASGMTFHEVAAKYHISPSVVSKAITKLENELDVSLFRNSSYRGMALSDAGDVLYREIVSLLPQYNHLRQSIKRYEKDRNLRVGYVTPSPDSAMNTLMLRFQNDYPDVTFTTNRYSSSEEAAEKLRTGSNDYVLMHKYPDSPTDLNYTYVCDDRLMIMLPSGHPMAKSRRVTLDDLRNDVFCINPAYEEIVSHIMPFFSYVPKMQHTFIGSLSMIQLVQSGQGIAFIYNEQIREFRVPGVVVIPVEDLPLSPIGLFSFGQTSTIAKRAFRDFILDGYERLSWHV